MIRATASTKGEREKDDVDRKDKEEKGQSMPFSGVVEAVDLAEPAIECVELQIDSTHGEHVVKEQYLAESMAERAYHHRKQAAGTPGVELPKQHDVEIGRPAVEEPLREEEQPEEEKGPHIFRREVVKEPRRRSRAAHAAHSGDQ